MPPIRPQFNSSKKPVKKIKILKINKGEQRSFFSLYFYQILLILFAAITFLLMGFRMRWDESGVIALWVVGIIFVVRQAHRFLKGETSVPTAKNSVANTKSREKKETVLAGPVKDYKPPELPRVSKDFSPMPPAGDKRYPPPSPFIKPPK